ncbi:alpha/beta hydrolase [Aquimarina sp. AU474]|uniref:alpha/beta hydrolase n=1 Tax=Aquimarina sp. AU474 TaxID=2108529 RepID=UPI000D68D9DB|nr:alpha/beta hydrolase [Aquimarina sp. AU474]
MTNRIIIKGLVLVLLVFVSGCYESTTTKENRVIITGNVSSSHYNKIRLTNKPIPIQNEWSVATDTSGIATIIDKEGDFRFEIEVDKPNFQRIIFGDRTIPLYLSPNDSISVTLDSVIRINGSNAHLNNYFLQQKEELDISEHYVQENLASIYALDEINFRKQLDSLKESNIRQYHTFINGYENVPSEFKERCMANINYLYKYYQLLYPSGHEIVTGKKANLPKNYLNEMSEGLNKFQFLNDEKYVTYLDKYVEVMSAGDLKERRYDNLPTEKIRARYYTIKNLSVNDEIKDYLFEQHFKICAINYSSKHWKGILDDLEKSNKNIKLVSKIKKQYQKSSELRKEPNDIRKYKQVNDTNLDAHIFYPKEHQKDNASPVYIYFHGGGWSLGMAESGYNTCKRMSEKGMVAISFEYRLIDVYGNDIQKSLEDAKSAIRWVRSQASVLGINPDKIVAAGFSAGAHLAASTAIINDFVSEDNKDFSSIPNLVITQSSSYDLTKGDGWFDGVSRGHATSISLLQNVKTGLPPFLSFHTTEDYLAPIYEFFQFKTSMETHKNDFQFQVFEGVGHFFRDKNAREKLNVIRDKYLIARGYITGQGDD